MNSQQQIIKDESKHLNRNSRTQSTELIVGHEYLNSEEYDMNRRGKCIIFYHTFAGTELERLGTTEDVQNIKETFKILKFKEEDIIEYTDLSSTKIEKKLEERRYSFFFFLVIWIFTLFGYVLPMKIY